MPKIVARNGRREGDDQRDPGAVDGPAEDVAAELVDPEVVLGGGAGRRREERIEGAGVAGVGVGRAGERDDLRREDRDQDQEEDEDERGEGELVLAELEPEELPRESGRARRTGDRPGRSGADGRLTLVFELTRFQAAPIVRREGSDVPPLDGPQVTPEDRMGAYRVAAGLNIVSRRREAGDPGRRRRRPARRGPPSASSRTAGSRARQPSKRCSSTSTPAAQARSANRVESSSRISSVPTWISVGGSFLSSAKSGEMRGSSSVQPAGVIAGGLPQPGQRVEHRVAAADRGDAGAGQREVEPGRDQDHRRRRRHAHLAQRADRRDRQRAAGGVADDREPLRIVAELETAR